MEVWCSFVFNFETKKIAKQCLPVIQKTIAGTLFQDSSATQIIADNCFVNGSEVEINNCCMNITASDSIDYVPEMLQAVYKALIEIVGKEGVDEITFEAGFNDTYENNYIEAFCNNGELTVKMEYYPYGYSNTAYCPECGEDIIERADWDGCETMICSRCGATVVLYDDENLDDACFGVDVNKIENRYIIA